MTEKKSSGAGKFFLGAALGAIAGAVAGKFMSGKGKCDCGEECDCVSDECDEPVKEAPEKPAKKAVAEKKPAKAKEEVTEKKESKK